MLKKFKIGDKVIYDDRKAKKFQFDHSHDLTYRDKVLTGIVAAVGEEGICVDFGEGFEGHNGSMPRNFLDELAQENFPNGYPDANYLNSGETTLWFFDYKGKSHEFLVSDLILIPSK